MKERTDMRKIREILRLHHECKVSQRQIFRTCRVGRSTVQDYLLRFKTAKLSWPLPSDLSDEGLEQLLFPIRENPKVVEAPISWAYIAEELRKPNVTLALLWEEYKQAQPDGYQYSRFTDLYRAYARTQQYSMRQIHKAGEKGFLDFGTGLSLINPKTGVRTPTQLFVFTWGASHCLYGTATLSEDIPSWLDANVNALEYFGCCPKALVPDNLKSAVTKACRYEPTINPSFAEFAEHYGVAILPARQWKPKDKAKVETGVKLAKRWILAKLCNRIFTTLEDLNESIAEMVEVFNRKPMRQFKKCRQELFELWDKPNALPLPARRYEYAEWKKVRVNIDYHVAFSEHHYSVPYTLIHQELELRATAHTIEICKKRERIASHRRSHERYGYTTLTEHMPKAHQKHLEWTPQRMASWAEKSGPCVKEFATVLMNERKHPEQAYKACLGLFRLESRYSKERLNDACQRALHYRNYSYHSVRNILAKGLDRQRDVQTTSITLSTAPPIEHDNIRGAAYFELSLFPEGGGNVSM